MNLPSITPDELGAILRSGRQVDVIDVRTPAEYREVHADMARLVPLAALDPKTVMERRNGRSGEPLYVICRTGSRAKQACEKFRRCGYDNVVAIEGGTLAWEQAGLPVARGRKAIALERQVRIAAGLLVLLGAALGAFVHPAFIGLAAFVGAGLIVAGVTDTCGLAMVLARMPWNRVGKGGGITCPRQDPAPG